MLAIFSLIDIMGGTPGPRLTETARVSLMNLVSTPLLEPGAVMPRVGVTYLERAFVRMKPLKTRLIVPSA